MMIEVEYYCTCSLFSFCQLVLKLCCYRIR